LTGRAGKAAFSGLLLGAGLAWAAFSGAAEGAEKGRLRLCNPDGKIRADRTSRGLRIRYIDKSGRAGNIDFTLPGWEVRSASVDGKKACLELQKRAGVQQKKRKMLQSARKGHEDVLHAEDEVIEYGGAFQDKVIIRRGRRVIDAGGERIRVEEKTVISPKLKTGPMETKP
jgi:hypothetical protein